MPVSAETYERVALEDDDVTWELHCGRLVENPGVTVEHDVCVVPDALAQQLRGTGKLEVYTDPLPFVAELWSPSTGRYDVNTKLLEYQRRGDREIWRIHPYEHIVTIWRRRPDGSYDESVEREGVITLLALPGVPGVRVDLAALFH